MGIPLMCTCVQHVPEGAKSQDVYYGQGKRYHNTTAKGELTGDTIYRCTVCGVCRQRDGTLR